MNKLGRTQALHTAIPKTSFTHLFHVSCVLDQLVGTCFHQLVTVSVSVLICPFEF